MIYGYARQSRKRNNQVSASIEEQLEVLKNYGCERFFWERKSGRKDREEFNKLMAEVRAGDVIVVKELSRLGRTALQLLQWFHDLGKRGVHLVAINKGIDSREPFGKFLFQLFSILSEVEIDQVEERTADLVEYGKKHGRKAGRKPGLSADAQEKARALLLLHGKQPVRTIRNTLGIASNKTYYKYLQWSQDNATSEL